MAPKAKAAPKIKASPKKVKDLHIGDVVKMDAVVERIEQTLDNTTVTYRFGGEAVTIVYPNSQDAGYQETYEAQ